MNAPKADHVEAERLIGELDKMRAALILVAAEDSPSDEPCPSCLRMAREIGFASDLLRTYAAERALSTPSPVTNTILIERHAVGDTPAPVDEIVLIWLAEDTDDGRPWLGHIDAGGRWWFVDASVARNVTHWAHRPRAAK